MVFQLLQFILQKGLRADRRSGPEDRRSSVVEGRGTTRLVARDRVHGCSLFTCNKLSNVDDQSYLSGTVLSAPSM